MRQDQISDFVGGLASYMAMAFGFLGTLPWGAIGAAVLLIARLIQDVPAAIAVIQKWRNNDKSNR